MRSIGDRPAIEEPTKGAPVNEPSGETTTEGGTRVHLELEHGYRFRADFGEGRPTLLMDEPPPLGDGAGPNASAALGAAVGNCLCASLLFCLRKAHIDVLAMTSDVQVTLARNARGRLRVSAVRVELHPRVAPGDEGRMRRCLELFEDFCVVSGAVRGGIGVDVSVSPDAGGDRAITGSGPGGGPGRPGGPGGEPGEPGRPGDEPGGEPGPADRGSDGGGAQARLQRLE